MIVVALLYGRESTELVSIWFVFQFYFALYRHVLYFCFSFHRLSRRNLCLSPTQRVTGGDKGLHGVTGGDKGLLGVTKGCKGLQRVTKGDKG